MCDNKVGIGVNDVKMCSIQNALSDVEQHQLCYCGCMTHRLHTMCVAAFIPMCVSLQLLKHFTLTPAQD